MNKTSLPSRCLVSGGDEIRLRSYVNHVIYARLHDLDYRLECGITPDITNKFHYKTSIIRRLLQFYDWLIWIDDDAFFTDFTRDNLNAFVDRAEQEDRFLVIANGPTEPNGFWSVINTGVMLLRNDPRTWQMLDAMHAVDLDTVKGWWSEDKHGVFTGGDQDEMLWALTTLGLLDQVLIVNHLELNSRGHYYEDSLHDAFVMHFCGHFDKPLGIARFARRFDIGQELVPQALLDEFSVMVRDPMRTPEFKARALRMDAVGAVKKRLRPHVHRYRRWRAQRRASDDNQAG